MAVEYLGPIRLFFDVGLVVLIWMVQLVVYPGFAYYSDTDLLRWHTLYTKRISLVVVPLMFGQLILAILQIIAELNGFSLGSILLILAVWGVTFGQFVPLHAKIAKGKATPTLLRRLIGRNWWRTLLWTALFALSAVWQLS